METSEKTTDHLSTHLDDILSFLTPSPSIIKLNRDVNNESVFRRNSNPTFPRVDLRIWGDLDPNVLAIGPFHHGKNELQKMEYHKLKYLQQLLQRRNGLSVDNMILAMRKLEGKARGYYDRVECSSEKFIQIMLVDGCFVVEFLRKLYSRELSDMNDLVFQPDNLDKVKCDLLLIENQVPLCVLTELFNITADATETGGIGILKLIMYYARDINPWSKNSQLKGSTICVDDVDHLLGLVHRIYCSSFMTKGERDKINDRMKVMSRMSDFELREQMMTVAVKCVSKLKKAGIAFQKNAKTENGMSIKFGKGVMQIPSVSISFEAWRMFANLIAYEQLVIHEEHCRYMTDYFHFLRHLVTSKEDAEILQRRGILTNLLHNYYELNVMLRTLCENSLVSPKNSCYADVYREVNEYCRLRGKKVISRHCCINGLSHSQ